MRLSICIPTYNRLSYLKKSITTILKSNRNDFEIVICDNHSIDGTEEYCTKLLKNDSRIKYFRNSKNLGISPNIHNCIKNSSSDYCYLISDEDEINQEIIDKIFPLLNNNYNAILSSVYDKKSNDYYIKRKSKYYKNFNFKLICNIHTYLSGIIVKKDCLDLNLLNNLSNEKHNIYHHIPILISCLIKGNCYISSEIFCFKGYQEFRSDYNNFLSNNAKSTKVSLPFYHLDNRIKQLIFFSYMTEYLSSNNNTKNIIYKYFAQWAVIIYNSDFIIKKFGTPTSQIIYNTKKINGIGKYFNYFLLKYKFISFLKFYIKKIILWDKYRKYLR